MEAKNDVKPENDTSDIPNEPPANFELDVSMLSKELYELEKQQKQNALIEQAKKQETKIIVSPQNQELEIKIAQSLDDYLYFFNEILENYKIEPFTDEEISQIRDMMEQIKVSWFSGINAQDPQPRSLMKDITLAVKTWRMIKNIIYPRIKPYMKPISEKFLSFFKDYFKIKRLETTKYGTE